jgi:hypothetical protein
MKHLTQTLGAAGEAIGHLHQLFASVGHAVALYFMH